MVALTEQIIRGKTRLDKMDDVKNLNLWGQDLDDVSVVAKLPNVEVLSLSVNRISTLRDFRHCPTLTELYLRKNLVADLSELSYLTGLRSLHTLWLSDNPCAEHPYYRQLVIRLLPSLQKLDNTDVTPLEREQARANPELEKYMSMLSVDAGGPASSSPRAPGGYGPPQPLSPSYYNGGGGAGGVMSPKGAPPPQYGGGGGGGYGGGSGRQDGGGRRKNVLYAVMALVGELDQDDLLYVKAEIEQRLGGLGMGR